MAEQPEIDIAVDYTVNIVANYVRANHVALYDLPGLIGAVHASVVRISTEAAPVEAAEVEKPSAAEIRKSVTPDALTSFIDGKTYKTLKRHLARHGLTPEGYRARFGLPTDYPVVAASYSQRRSELAKSLGLGTPGARGGPAPATLN